MSQLASMIHGDLDLTTFSSFCRDVFLVDVLVLLPLGILLGAFVQRLVTRAVFPNMIAIWNLMVRVLVAHLVTHSLLSTVACLELVVGTSSPTTTSVSDMPALLLFWRRSLSIVDNSECPYSISSTGGAQIVVFFVRVFFVVFGVYLGELWTPIAITGNIGCGKTTVTKRLLEGQIYDGGKTGENYGKSAEERHRPEDLMSFDHEFCMIDVDCIAHDILLPTTPGSVYEDVVNRFGTEILSQSEDNNGFPLPKIDRNKLGDVVFGNEQNRRALNRLTHPRIVKIMLQKILYHSYFPTSLFKHKLVLVEIPLLFESGKLLRWVFCLVVVVATSPELQRQRLRARNPELSDQNCRQRIQSQMPMEYKIKHSDIVIYNDFGSKSELEKEVDRIRQELVARVAGTGGIRLYHCILVFSLVFAGIKIFA